MSHIIGLKCTHCGEEYPATIQNTCHECFGLLAVNYDWDYIQDHISKEKIKSGPNSIWRYADLLPVETTDYVDLGTGYNRLQRARHLEEAIGL
ncbi:MAG: threonine synthase, partial [Methanosarcinales archaeon]